MNVRPRYAVAVVLGVGLILTGLSMNVVTVTTVYECVGGPDDGTTVQNRQSCSGKAVVAGESLTRNDTREVVIIGGVLLTSTGIAYHAASGEDGRTWELKWEPPM